ncbi:MAG: Uma2 family endonuclease [Chloroflexota bacterium]
MGKITSPTETFDRAPTLQQTLNGNGAKGQPDTSDWLDDPLEAEERMMGPYRVTDMEVLLEQKFSIELYNGWIVWRPMSDKFERTALSNIQDMLSVSARKADYGQVLPDGTECVLDDGNDIIPDAALVSWQRLEKDFTRHGPNKRPLLIRCPELVIESRSPSNTRKGDRLKRTKYFNHGTRIVWDVDEPNKCVHVYRAEDPEKPITYTVNDTVDCEPLLPGWKRRVADIFDERVSAESVVGEAADEWRHEGIVEGRKEGIVEGRKEGIATVAENMLQQGVDVALVVSVTDLSEAEVQAIAKALAEKS